MTAVELSVPVVGATPTTLHVTVTVPFSTVAVAVLTTISVARRVTGGAVTVCVAPFVSVASAVAVTVFTMVVGLYWAVVEEPPSTGTTE